MKRQRVIADHVLPQLQPQGVARDQEQGFEQPVPLIGSRSSHIFKVSRLLEQCHSLVEAPRRTMDFTHKRVFYIVSTILDPLVTEEPDDETAEDET